MVDVNSGNVGIACGLLVFTYWWFSQRRTKPFCLNDRVVIITGGANGIGKQLAHTILHRVLRPTVVLLDVDAHALDKTKVELEKQYGSCVLTFVCDVSNDGEVHECVRQISSIIAPKRISVLINNAGIVSGRYLTQLTPDQVRRTFMVNTMSQFWTTQAVLPILQSARDGLIVTVSSVMGLIGAAGLSDYCASKFALCGFHDALRMELWRDGYKNDIHTLLVCPNGVNSGMFEGMFESNHWTVALSQFLIPTSTEQQAASRIYQAMVNKESMVISCYTGWRGWVVPWLPAIARLFPPAVHDWIVYLAGGLHGMESFISRKEAQSDTSTTSSL